MKRSLQLIGVKERGDRAYFIFECICGSKVCQTVESFIFKPRRICRQGCRFSGYHFLTNTSEHQAWRNMIGRCTSPTHPMYKHYGGRGIKVHPDWQRSFETFLAYIGPKPSKDLSIDRINNDGHYEPGNVRWATQTIQQNNRRKRR